MPTTVNQVTQTITAVTLEVPGTGQWACNFVAGHERAVAQEFRAAANKLEEIANQKNGQKR